jgi:hypothetical protein
MRYDGYSPRQKWIQSLVALLVPIFGTVLVHMMLRAATAKPAKKNDRYDPDYGIGSGG